MSNYLVVKDKVQRFAKELFDHVLIDNDGDLVIPYESTRVFVTVTDKAIEGELLDFYNEHQLSHIAVEVWAPVIIEAKPSNDLFEWVACEGQDYVYGGFRVTRIKDSKLVEVHFRVALPGDTLDPGELKDALVSVAFTADEMDDILIKKFGGKRVEDIA